MWTLNVHIAHCATEYVSLNTSSAGTSLDAIIHAWYLLQQRDCCSVIDAAAIIIWPYAWGRTNSISSMIIHFLTIFSRNDNNLLILILVLTWEMCWKIDVFDLNLSAWIKIGFIWNFWWELTEIFDTPFFMRRVHCIWIGMWHIVRWILSFWMWFVALSTVKSTMYYKT